MSIGAGMMMLALGTCSLPMRALAEATIGGSSIQAPAEASLPGAKVFYSSRHFYAYGLTQKAIVVEQAVYSYPFEDRERFLWLYRVTNLIRPERTTQPSQVVSFRLDAPGAEAAMKATSVAGWIPNPDGLSSIEWQAQDFSDAVLFPGATADFVFTTERCNLVKGSGSIALQGGSYGTVISMDGADSPDVPSQPLGVNDVNCCMIYGGHRVCGGASSISECHDVYHGTWGCSNCGNAEVTCCFAHESCGTATEQGCVMMGGTIVSDCGSCPMNYVTCCQLGSMSCGTMTQIGCQYFGFPVGDCSQCSSHTTVNCCTGNGICSPVPANQCGGSVVSDCATCAWTATKNRSWGQVKGYYR